MLNTGEDRRNPTRRVFLARSAAAVGAAAFGMSTIRAWAEDAPAVTTTGPAGGPEVTTIEDLMREHGLLRRIMLVYDDAGRRLADASDLPVEPLRDAADLVRRFIEDYHEKLEEDYIFPLFTKAGKLTDLVKVLLAQHQAGRTVTANLQRLLKTDLKDAADRQKAQSLIRDFTRMYRPHAAREDTVLFPTLHALVTDKEYDAMGDKFEDQEQKLFGKDGFEKVVTQVSQIEKAFGLLDLDQFTPTAGTRD